MAARNWPREQIKDGDREHVERRRGIELTGANLLRTGMDQRQAACHKPTDWDIGAKSPLPAPALDQLSNDGSGGVVGTSHCIGAQIRGGSSGNVLVMAELLPTRGKQAP
jgi:hypothetical protein